MGRTEGSDTAAHLSPNTDEGTVSFAQGPGQTALFQFAVELGIEVCIGACQLDNSAGRKGGSVPRYLGNTHDGVRDCLVLGSI